MFDRCPDPTLLTDLVAVQHRPPPASAAAAASALMDELLAWQRMASWIEWQRLDTMRRFAEARRAADIDLAAPDGDAPDLGHLSPSQRASISRLEADLDSQAGRFAADEIALGLNMSVASVERQLTLARDLHDVHRDLSEALELGQVTGFVAAMVAQATRKLPDDARRLLDPAVASDATEQPPGRAIDAARARVSEIDAFADIAAASAVSARTVFLKPLDDGVAMLGAILPAADAVRAYSQLDGRARTARAHGDPRTLDQLRADTLTDLLSVGAATGVGAANGAATSESAGTGKRPVSVQVVISISSLLGLDSKAAHLDGYGTLSAGAARALIGAGDITLTRLVCDPDTGAVLATDPTTYQPSDRLRHAVSCRDRHCRMPVCAARVRHLDHIQARVDGGLTTTDNLHGLCQRSHLAKHHPGWRAQGDANRDVIWTTPTGRSYTSVAPPVTGVGTGPPGDPDTDTALPSWLSRSQADAQAIAAWRQRGQAA